MSGEHTAEHDYNTFLVEIEQKFAILEKMDPSNKKYNLIWGPLLSQFMQLLNAAKKSSSHIFLQDNRNKIIDMCNKLFATITNQQLQLSNENKELAKKLRDAFLEAAENIATTNNPILAILGVTLFENALKTAVQIQDPTWHSDPTRAKTIRDLHLKLSLQYSPQQRAKISQIISTYFPTRVRQGMNAARSFARTHAQYEHTESATRSQSNYQQEAQRKQMVLNNLAFIIDTCNYINNNSMSRQAQFQQVLSPEELAILFLETLKVCLTLENFEGFISDYIQNFDGIYQFMKTRFDSTELDMQEIDILMQAITTNTPKTAQPSFAYRNGGHQSDAQYSKTDSSTTSDNGIKTTQHVINHILDLLCNYETTTNVTTLGKQSNMATILQWFNWHLHDHIQNHIQTQTVEAIKNNYARFTEIYEFIQRISNRDKLRLPELQTTNTLMQQIIEINNLGGGHYSRPATGRKR